MDSFLPGIEGVDIRTVHLVLNGGRSWQASDPFSVTLKIELKLVFRYDKTQLNSYLEYEGIL